MGQGSRRKPCSASELSSLVIEHCAEILDRGVPDEGPDRDAMRLRLSQLRESNRAVLCEVKRVSTICKAMKLGLAKEAEALQ